MTRSVDGVVPRGFVARLATLPGRDLFLSGRRTPAFGSLAAKPRRTWHRHPQFLRALWLFSGWTHPAPLRSTLGRWTQWHHLFALVRGIIIDSLLDLDLSGADMEIILDRRALKQIRLSATDAIEEDDTETLREDIIDAFSEEQVEEIERRIDGGDFYELLSELIDEWSGDDVDELLELIEAQLSEAGMDLKYATDEYEEEEEEEEPAAADDDDEVIEDDTDLALDDEEADEETEEEVV
jgi:hypothetical protein